MDKVIEHAMYSLEAMAEDADEDGNADRARLLRTCGKMLRGEIERLEDMLFSSGAMEAAPCFCCGYNGPGYYQPDKHPCATRHHKLARSA